MHLNHIYELSTLLLGAGWRYDTRRSLQTLPSLPPRMRSWMDEEAGEAVASDGVGERGAGEGGMQALLYVPRCWRAQSCARAEAVVACVTWCGGQWLEEAGLGF
jgi:hypothetical protein